MFPSSDGPKATDGAFKGLHVIVTVPFLRAHCLQAKASTWNVTFQNDLSAQHTSDPSTGGAEVGLLLIKIRSRKEPKTKK